MSGVRPGDVIAGKFRVERVLGEGGMGYVVAAMHLQLGQRVALKFMREEICTPEYKSRFIREARNTVRLKSKHVSRVLDVGTLDSGSPYMVMEYLEGTDLSDLLHKRGPVPVNEACDYIIQACEAIAEAHSYGIVHRDLKPANLFLSRGANGEPIVKVLDFGVSKVLELGMDETKVDSTSASGRPEEADSVVTKATDLLGSPNYMAPEQVVSARDADARSDIWSLGVILFRLLTGKAPFQAASLGELIQGIMHGRVPNLREVKPDLPPGLDLIVARCLERDREKRLADVTELARLLAPYAGPVPTPSLERIAILGPALVAARGPRIDSNPSGPSSFGGSVPRSAWTTAPPPPPPMTPVAAPMPKRPMSVFTAVAWGVLFVGAVLFGIMLIAMRVRSADAETPTGVPMGVTSGGIEPPPQVIGSPVSPEPPPTGAPGTSVSVGPKPHPNWVGPSRPTRPPRGGGKGQPGSSEIPATRE